MKLVAKKSKLNIIFIVTLVILIIYAISMLIPVIWTLMTTLKDYIDYEDGRNILWLPSRWEFFTFNNYALAYEYFFVSPEGSDLEFYIIDQFLNSILYSFGSAFTITLSTLVMGYATSRFKYKFSGIIYTFVLVAIALPIVGSMPSEIAVADFLGIFDTFHGMWIMRGNFLNTYFLIFFAQFKMIPYDYTEAAKIDGASPFTIMFKIIVPLAISTIITVFVLNFIGFWNDFQIPMIYLKSHPVAAYGMYSFQEANIPEIKHIPTQLAGICLMAFPIVIFYAIFNARLNVNMSVGGIKG